MASLIGKLTGTDERHVAEPEGTGRGGGEHRGDVVGGGEQDADEVVVADAVSLQHRGDEGLHPIVHLLDGVLIEGCRSP